MIICSDGSLYTGISNDVSRRFAEHRDLKGAKYFRSRQPQQLVYLETGHTRSTASKREIAIKKLPRLQKQQLIDSDDNQVGTCLQLQPK